MNYKQEMKSNSADKLQVEVDKEHKWMVDNVEKDKISPDGANPIDSTWAMIIKADGTLCAV